MAAAAERSTAVGAGAAPAAGMAATVIGMAAAIGVAIIAIECIDEDEEDDDEDFVGVVESFSTTENFRIMSLSSCDMMWQCQM